MYKIYQLNYLIFKEENKKRYQIKRYQINHVNNKSATLNMFPNS